LLCACLSPANAQHFFAAWVQMKNMQPARAAKFFAQAATASDVEASK
jgi:hypothetical protein